MATDENDIIAVIREAVRARGWTARDLERAAGISYPTARKLLVGDPAWSRIVDHVLDALDLRIS